MKRSTSDRETRAEMAERVARKTRTWVMLSPWIVIATVIILVPIVILMTFFSIEKQREAMTSLLAEKGAALIRSVEAGARSGAPGRDDPKQQIQSLLVETAQQPDILYLLITDMNGLIIFHNNPLKIGTYHGRELDLREIADMNALFYRTLPEAGDVDIFEVFQNFSLPSTLFPSSPERPIPDDLFRRGTPSQPELMIFVGLDRAPVASVLRSDTRVTVAMALILLLLGFTGFISLLIAQGYRQARTSLSQVKAFSDNLLEHVPIGIIATDASGFITSCNREAESILQVDAATILGKQGRSALPPALAVFLEGLTETNAVIDEEIECPLSGNRKVSLDAIATLLVEDDHGMGAILIIRDLTEVKRLQKEIDRSRRLASLGRLAAGVAHEIRNPLSSIKGFATYFKERYRDVPEDRKIAAIMIDEVDRLNRVVGQLLDFSRPVKVRSTTVPVVSLVEQSLEMIESRLREKNITVETEFPHENREISVDADGLSQSLLNLYINAMEAMPSKGRLTVRVGYSVDNAVVITVADTGTGIDRADQARIFDPYFTTKPSGTGLGLAIVHKIVEAHDGAVAVESEPNQGAVVTITIPHRKNDGKGESWNQ